MEQGEGEGLTREQRRFFNAHGYIVLRGAVPSELCTDVLERADRRRTKMQRDGSWGKVKDFNFPRLGKSDALFSLVRAPRVAAAMEQLLGAGSVALPPRGVVKWVGKRRASSERGAGGGEASGTSLAHARLNATELDVWQDYWHIDGAGNSHLLTLKQRSDGLTGAQLRGGLRVGKSRTGGSVLNFSLLCGVFLHDIPQPWRGNFTVWPGAHHACMALIAERGLDSFIRERPSFAALCAMAEARCAGGVATPHPAPVQLCVQQGDVVLAHPLLPHAAGWNFDAPGRFATYFRVRHAEHDVLREKVLDGDLWRELRAAEVD